MFGCYYKCLKTIKIWFGLNGFTLPTKTVEGSSFLAQVSVSRLGEISSNSPKLLARAVAQATSSYFEREPVSLRRGGLA